ncbi:lactoylglutathione lyase-like [Gossypium arboreum]|uniref:lactoylglutathione lyase-like n=1 Tax=Gossypium arboreum TaxID=29729 RepID=UPI000818F470|nr:lactoylglutathione lyase-like [Gossypium arboreum]
MSNWDTESDQEFEGYQTGNSEPLGSGHIGITLDDTIKACERFQRLGVEFSKKQLCISHGDYLRLEYANIFLKCFCSCLVYQSHLYGMHSSRILMFSEEF